MDMRNAACPGNCLNTCSRAHAVRCGRYENGRKRADMCCVHTPLQAAGRYSCKKYHFTLIERVVITAQHCRDFISNACIVSLQNTPLFFESERGFGGKRKPSFPVKRKFSLSPKLSPFTLIELVVTIAIIVLTVALVTAVFGRESPARQMSRMELDFRNYCARVRYRACESGRDWVVKFDPDAKVFSAELGKQEKFQMPGGDEVRSEVRIEDDPEEEEKRLASGDDEDAGQLEGYSRLEWRLPEKVEFTTENAEEDSLATGEKLEIFRFFPDGGGSGSGYLEFRCGELSRIFRITKLTGRLFSVDKEEFEREKAAE